MSFTTCLYCLKCDSLEKALSCINVAWGSLIFYKAQQIIWLHRSHTLLIDLYSKLHCFILLS